MSHTIEIPCPECSKRTKLYLDYDTPDRNAGYTGGWYLTEGETTCPNCGHEFNEYNLDVEALGQELADDAAIEAADRGGWDY